MDKFTMGIRELFIESSENFLCVSLIGQVVLWFVMLWFVAFERNLSYIEIVSEYFDTQSKDIHGI